ncbi:MAG: phosphate uptake regulator PhoU [Marinifilaceae bacterium]
MSIRKDKIFNKVDKDFSKAKNILFRQFDILEDLIIKGMDNIPEEMLMEFKKNEDKLDQFEIRISEEIIQIIVLHQPMASDLRQIISYFRMIGNIERIGDQINNIVSFISKLTPRSIPSDQQDSVLNMFTMSLNMVKKSLISFEEEDQEYAIWTIKNDEVVDDLQYRLVKLLINKKTPEGVQPLELYNVLNFNSILSSIERIADNATNIAEASIYYQKGIDLRHQEVDEEDL